MKTGNNALAVTPDEVSNGAIAQREKLLWRDDRPHAPLTETTIAPTPFVHVHPHASPDRRWLGVCLTLSKALRIPVLIVRALFLAIGLATGPLSLLLYLWIYAGQRLADRTPLAILPSARKLGTTMAQTLGVVVVLYLGARLSFIAAYEGFLRFAQQELSIGQLGWLNAYHEWFLILVLITVLPIAALSALPLARQWDRTWNTFLRASVRVYALVLLAGVVSGGLGLIVQSATVLVR